MKRTNQLTYTEKKKLKRKKMFNRTLGGLLAIVTVATLGDLVIDSSKISNIREKTSTYFARKADEMNQESYLKLRSYVVGEELVEPIQEQGWRGYTEDLFEKYPCANGLGSFNQWTNFFKVYNGGKDPGIERIRFPKVDCNKDVSNS